MISINITKYCKCNNSMSWPTMV